jgi:hypothetical protein
MNIAIYYFLYEKVLPTVFWVSCSLIILGIISYGILSTVINNYESTPKVTICMTKYYSGGGVINYLTDDPEKIKEALYSHYQYDKYEYPYINFFSDEQEFWAACYKAQSSKEAPGPLRYTR